jgi:hypothetical protein
VVFRGVIHSAIFRGRNSLFKTVIGEARQIFSGLRLNA